MADEVDRTALVLASQLQGDDAEDTLLLREMYQRAQKFLTSFRWCREIRETWFGFGVGKVVAVFLCDIVPAEEEVDETLWIIVGDIPPSIILTDENPTAIAALGQYVEEMRRWVSAVRTGSPSVDDCLPVNVPPTEEWAAALESRMNFLDENFLANPEAWGPNPSAPRSPGR